MEGAELATEAATAAKWLGGGAAMFWLYRFLVFGCNFLAGRHDTRQGRLEAREVRLEKSIGKRLEHLEQFERNSRVRMALLEDCVAILATELRQQDPTNAKLKVVGQMLANVHPVVPPDAQLDELMKHAARGVDKAGDGA